MAKIETMNQWQEYCLTRRKFDRHEIKWNEKQNLPEHLRKLYEIEKPLTASDISYDLLYDMFIEIARKATGGAFVVDNSNETTISLLIQYIREDEAFLSANPSYSFNKGLLLHGPVGTGKTLLMKILHDLITGLRFFNIHQDRIYYSGYDCFSVITSNDIVQRFSLDGYMIFLEGCNDRKISYVDLINKPLLVDDLGSEPEAVHFGAKTNILAELIIRRYERGSKTHATTNLAMDSLKKSYDLRAFDRMREMFNDIKLTGNSRRK